MIDVLLVDDEPTLLDLTKIFLERNGEFRIDTSISVADAMEKMQVASYDAIVSDYEMPGMDGIEFLKSVRSSDSKIPFIIFTGKGREEVVIEAINNGADFYLQKGGAPKAQFAELTHKIVQCVEKKKAEDELQLTQFSVDHAADAVFWVMEDGGFFYVNESACQLLGLSHDDLLNMSVPDIDPGYKWENHRKHWEELREKKQMVFRSEIQRKDGKSVPVEISVNFLDFKGIEYEYAFVRDITETKHHEEEFERANKRMQAALEEAEASKHSLFDQNRELEESEERYRKLVEISPEAIGIHSNGKVVYINQVGLHLLAAGSIEELNNKSIPDYVSPDFSETVCERIKKSFYKRKPAEFVYEKLFRLDNQEIDVEIGAVPITYKGDPATLFVIRDITERKQVEESLKIANKKLNLLSDITRHDILNQITGLVGYNSLLDEILPTDPSIQKYMRNINEITNSIQRKIVFSRDYQNLGVNSPEWQTLKDVIQKAAATVPLDGIHLDIGLGNLEVLADPMLEKVFFNLLDNVVRHGEGVTEIKVSFHENEGNGAIILEDNGIGVPEEKKARIFSQGFGRGSGLGLFLVREVLEITGMNISEIGKEGKGARFEIVLPNDRFRIE